MAEFALLVFVCPAMPGYRALSSSVTGLAADSAREAESLRRDGDPENAVLLLEEALAASERVNPELPGWLCGRLAALYRTLGRYDDEVLLLERYRESQTSEEARSRYDARLSKARTIAERKRRSDSGALSSVRKVLGTPRRRGGTPAGGVVIQAPRDRGAEFIALLADLLGEATTPDSAARVDLVVAQYAADGRANGVPIERLVSGLRTASSQAVTLHVDADERDRRFSAALVGLLAAYFEERER
ncbi:MAG: hypothetical protein JWL60_2673 [Gemmatimonadetes bacterium]|jgi:hypothetical protein|nr:hypothetical protein [Gemmatimonadota bacterium]